MLLHSYDKYEKPDWVPGSSFGFIAAGYVVTGMLDGVAIYAGLQVSRYELFKSISTGFVFLIFKTFYFIWPAVLWHFENLIMVRSHGVCVMGVIHHTQLSATVNHAQTH